MKRYRVTLTSAERAELAALLARGKADVRKLKHAQVLLKADEAEGGPGWPDERIAEAIGVGVATVERVRRRFVEESFAAALSACRKGTRVYTRKLDGAQEAQLIALACSAPPEGRGRWALRLLASRMVALRHTDALSHETVRRTLKKERPQAAPAADVARPPSGGFPPAVADGTFATSAPARGRVRLPHGGRAGGLSSSA